MSVVSGVVLMCSVCEDELCEDGLLLLLQQVNHWLKAHHFGPLADLTEHTGGNKHPQMCVFGSGYNFFLEEEFAQMVMALPWECPDNVILILNPEEGPSSVFRPRSPIPEDEIDEFPRIPA